MIRRAAMLFGLYAGLLAAVVAAGFLAQAVCLWAAILWAVLIAAAVVVYLRRRARRPVGRT